ncbi:MAG: FAD-dependent oxidoreductase [Chloroflexi bacterium]|nr:FAD-dependent oxidoreductase [Chloroflexota bacterium]
MSKPYDFVVIGAGSAGLLAAPLAAKLGARVALVERDRPGGDCLYTGCVPSKTLLKVAKVAHEIRRAAAFGLDAAPPSVDMSQVSSHIQDVIGRIYEHDSPEALRAQGVDVFLGPARFIDAHTLSVNGRAIRGRRFLICTGSRPIRPDIPGLADVSTLTYEDIFSLRVLPPRLLVIGAGPIGMEMSQAFARLGSSVTVFQRATRLLTVADADCSAVMADVFSHEGITVRLGASIDRVDQDGDEIAVTTSGDRVVGDALLVAVGRAPTLDGLDIERAGVTYSRRGIAVDAYLRTSQPHIYACGDVLGGEQFTHLAAIQAYQATRNALLPGKTRGTLEAAPWTVFTDPEVARAGLTEDEARARHGSGVRVFTLPLARVDRAQAEEDRHGLVKLVYRPNGKILGAHIVAARAGEMIQEVITAMDQGKTLRHLASAMHVYPTYSVGVQQAAAFALEQSVFGGLTGRLIRLVTRLT